MYGNDRSGHRPVPAPTADLDRRPGVRQAATTAVRHSVGPWPPPAYWTIAPGTGVVCPALAAAGMQLWQRLAPIVVVRTEAQMALAGHGVNMAGIAASSSPSRGSRWCSLCGHCSWGFV